MYCTYRLRTQEETAKQLESEKRLMSDAAQNLEANLKVYTYKQCMKTPVVLMCRCGAGTELSYSCM